MYTTLSYVSFIIGIFAFGIIMFPLGMFFASMGVREGEKARPAGILNLIGFIFMVVVFLFVFMLI